MKKLCCFFVLIIANLLCCFCAFALQPTELVSEAAVLMDAETGQVLFNKNMDKAMYPASTTKIMTGLLVAEACDMNDIATASGTAFPDELWETSNIATQKGEQLSINDLMYALMLPSANDAANILAEQVAGSQTNFAAAMNERAQKLGALNTHFTNANGLHNRNHYTTAYDLALITREAAKNPILMHYISATAHTIWATNLCPTARELKNYQFMLVPGSLYYNPDVLGGKVGYTPEARHTMTTVAERDGRTLICVVLNSANTWEKFDDTQKLLDFGFNEFVQITVPEEQFSSYVTDILSEDERVGTVSFYAQQDFTALLHKDVDPAQIEMAYTHEGPYHSEENLCLSVCFTAGQQNPAIPAALGEIKLKPDTTLFANVTTAVLSTSMAGGKKPAAWLAVVAIVFVLLAVFLFAARRQYDAYSFNKCRHNRLREWSA